MFAIKIILAVTVIKLQALTEGAVIKFLTRATGNNSKNNSKN